MTNLLKKLSFSVVLTTVALTFPASTYAFSLYPSGYDETNNGDLSNNRLTPTQLGLLTGTSSLKATFKAGSDTPDPDFYTFIIPKGQYLSSIILKSWSTSPDFEDIAFIAIEEGATFDFQFGGSSGNTVNNANPAAGLLGWSHLRSTQVGTNKILTEMSSSNLDPFASGLNASVNAEADSNPYASIPGLTPEQITTLTNNLRSIGTIGDPLSSTPNNGWYPGATGFDVPLGPGTYSIWLRQGSPTEIGIELEFNTTPIPEPLTMLGAGTALGIGAFFKRTVSKKQKKNQ